MTSYLKPLNEYLEVRTYGGKKFLRLLHCKRCKADFAVCRDSRYYKDVNYCPYCGQPANPQRKSSKDTDGDL